MCGPAGLQIIANIRKSRANLHAYGKMLAKEH